MVIHGHLRSFTFKKKFLINSWPIYGNSCKKKMKVFFDHLLNCVSIFAAGENNQQDLQDLASEANRRLLSVWFYLII